MRLWLSAGLLKCDCRSQAFSAALQSNRVVSLDLNFSERGVPSIQLFPDSHITEVFDHLQRLGHTRIDCVSAHVHNPEIERRIRCCHQAARELVHSKC